MKVWLIDGNKNNISSNKTFDSGCRLEISFKNVSLNKASVKL
jgi:hypothetical protein